MGFPATCRGTWPPQARHGFIAAIGTRRPARRRPRLGQPKAPPPCGAFHLVVEFSCEEEKAAPQRVRDRARPADLEPRPLPPRQPRARPPQAVRVDRKSTRLNSSHLVISY